MKIRVKFDNTNFKINCSRKPDRSKQNSQQTEPALFEIDLDSLYSLFRLFPPAIADKFGWPVAKPDETGYQVYEDAAGIPRRIPATGHDIYNYAARYGAANFQIQTVMKLDGKLDREKLQKAVRFSIDAEPVFGCRFVEGNPPYWKRLDNIDNVEFCTIEDTGNSEEAIKRFLESSFSMDSDPMVKLKLISSGSNDTLCLKINHTCCDGTGTKEYLQLLSDIYTELDTGKGSYEPKPSKRTRIDQDRLFEALGIQDPETAWSPIMEPPELLWTFPWLQGRPVKARVAFSRLPDGQIETISAYAKKRGANINDIIVTALYRIMFEISGPQYGIPMHIPMTVDLRRYLPNKKTEAIRNFSGGIDTSLSRVENESFEETLSRIVPLMDAIKDSRPGLQSAVGLERVEKGKFYDTLSFYRNAGKGLTYTDEFAPVLSNLSFISKALLRFGTNYVTDAYIIPPALSAPGLLLCVSTYNNIITLAVSYYEEQVREVNIKKFLNQIIKEIVDGCKPQ